MGVLRQAIPSCCRLRDVALLGKLRVGSLRRDDVVSRSWERTSRGRWGLRQNLVVLALVLCQGLHLRLQNLMVTTALVLWQTRIPKRVHWTRGLQGWWRLARMRYLRREHCCNASKAGPWGRCVQRHIGQRWRAVARPPRRLQVHALLGKWRLRAFGSGGAGWISLHQPTDLIIGRGSGGWSKQRERLNG